MNRKEAIVVTVLVLATFITGAYADTLSTVSTTRGTLQTASVDIEAFKVNPGPGGPFSSSGAFICGGCGTYGGNFTAAFSFSPKGFVNTNIVTLTLSYYGGHVPPEPLSIRLNGNSPNVVPTVSSSLSTTTANIAIQQIRFGANMVDIGFAAVPPAGDNFQATIFEARLTVEYTYLA